MMVDAVGVTHKLTVLTFGTLHIVFQITKPLHVLSSGGDRESVIKSNSLSDRSHSLKVPIIFTIGAPAILAHSW